MMSTISFFSIPFILIALLCSSCLEPSRIPKKKNPMERPHTKGDSGAQGDSAVKEDDPNHDDSVADKIDIVADQDFPSNEDSSDSQGSNNSKTEDRAEDADTDIPINPMEPPMRLLKPSELGQRGKDLFGSNWTLKVDLPILEFESLEPEYQTEFRYISGFRHFQLSLNGVDYVSVEEYPKRPTPLFVAAQSVACDALASSVSDDALEKFSQLDSRIQSEKELAAMQQSAIIDLTQMVFGIPLEDTYSLEKIKSLYWYLNELDSNERKERTPVAILAQTLCSTFLFAHSN